MTLQDLKNSREQIIVEITNKLSSKMVKPVMAKMVDLVSDCDSIEELISEAIYFTTQYEVREEKSQNAFILGRLEQIEIENN